MHGVCSTELPSGRLCSVWLISRPLACAVALAGPVSGAPAQLQHLHLASITKPCYCRVAAPSLHSVCTPEFGFVASSEITNHTQPKSSTAHVVFDGQVINWTLLGIRHLSDCVVHFFFLEHVGELCIIILRR